MKKNRTSLYVLLPLVLGIWGYIGWKLYAGMQREDVALPSQAVQRADGNNERVPDTFQLVANYRDPFLGKAEVVRTANPAARSTQQASAQKKIAPVASTDAWPNIVYKGMIQEKQGAPYALLSVDGADHLLQAGERAHDIQLLVISRDSLQVMWRKQKRFVRK